MEPSYTVMLTSGRVAGCNENLISADPKAIAAFLKRNRTTGGFTIQYAFHRTKHVVVEIFKKGKVVQRDIAALIAEGFDEWQWNWAWAGESFQFADGTLVTKGKTREEKAQKAALTADTWKEVDLTTLRDVAPFVGLLG